MARRTQYKEIFKLKKSHVFYEDEWIVTARYQLRVSAKKIIKSVRLRSRNAYPVVIHVSEEYLSRHFVRTGEI